MSLESHAKKRRAPKAQVSAYPVNRALVPNHSSGALNPGPAAAKVISPVEDMVNLLDAQLQSLNLAVENLAEALRLVSLEDFREIAVAGSPEPADSQKDEARCALELRLNALRSFANRIETNVTIVRKNLRVG